MKDSFRSHSEANTLKQYSTPQTTIEQYPFMDSSFQEQFISAPPGFSGSLPTIVEAISLIDLDEKKKKRKKKKENSTRKKNSVQQLSSNLIPLSIVQNVDQHMMTMVPVMVPPDTEIPRKKKISKLKVRATDPTHLRQCAGETWIDRTLTDWPDNDFRVFVGDLGNEVSDAMLTTAFSKYPSFTRAKVIRDKRNGKSRGYGFVSFLDPQDFLRALREMDGKYVGNRPIKVKKSKWKERTKKVKKFVPGLKANRANKRYNDPGPV